MFDHRPDPRRERYNRPGRKPDGPERPRSSEPREPPPPLPEGVGLVHLRSAGYGAFVYERMVDVVTGAPQDGDMVGVVDKSGRVFGWGFYHSRSPLALRMFWHRAERPTEQDIAARVARAVAMRRDVLGLHDTDAYRLIHAEGDGLSGLVADRFGQHVVIELFSMAMFRRLNMIEDAIVDAGLSVRGFVVRADKAVCQQEGFVLGREVDRKDRSTVITENGVRFEVRLATGHKTGFFCDQRENRLALTQFTPGKTVLDCCCYTGGFACYAAGRGQAQAVSAVDLDENALEVARRNAELNSLAIGTGPGAVEFHHADAFDFLRQAAAGGRRWDVVVLDPSKFVAKRTAMETGLRKYADLNRLAAGALAPGGLLLTCSCSGLVDQDTFVQTVAKSLRAAGREAQVFRVTGAGPDHPFMAGAPESAYLKALWAIVN